MPELRRAVEIRPHFESAEEALGSAYEDLGKDAEALEHWRRAHSIDPSRLSATLGLAWLLATAPDASVRKGAEAVQLAERAKDSAPENADALDTLAAAYAEDGQFTRAAATAADALQLAQAQGNERLAAELRARQALYGKGEAFRELKAPVAVSQAGATTHRAQNSQ